MSLARFHRAQQAKCGLARFRAAQAQRDEDRRVYRQLGRARAKRERKRARQVVLPTWRPDKRTNTQAERWRAHWQRRAVEMGIGR